MGGVSGEPTREAEEQSSTSRGSQTVEGTLLLRASEVFADLWKNEDLGRSDTAAAGLVPRQYIAPMTGGALWKNEEGNDVSVRQAHALDVVTRSPRRRARGRVLHSVQRPVHVSPHGLDPTRGVQAPRGGAIDSVSRSGKPARAGGTGTGAVTVGRMRGSPRVNRSLGDQGGSVTRQKRKVVMAIVPARIREPRAQRPYVVVVAEVGRQRPGLEYAHAQRSEKSDGGSEQGPRRPRRVTFGLPGAIVEWNVGVSA